MQIDDLTAGLSLNFLIHLNTEQLQFESKILEVYPRRHTLLAEGVFTDDKIISFRGKGLVVDLIVTFPEEKPQLFKNVTTNVVKRADGTLCYTVFSVAGSKTCNRREILCRTGCLQWPVRLLRRDTRHAVLQAPDLRKRTDRWGFRPDQSESPEYR